MVTGSLDLKIIKKKNEEKFSGLVNALVSNQAPSVLKQDFQQFTSCLGIIHLYMGKLSSYKFRLA